MLDPRLGCPEAAGVAAGLAGAALGACLYIGGAALAGALEGDDDLPPPLLLPPPLGIFIILVY